MKRPADSTVDPMERKRIQHVSAEQSRRFALKEGFDQLKLLLPNLGSGGTKATNAAVLWKAGQYLREIRQRLDSQRDSIAETKQKVQEMNAKVR